MNNELILLSKLLSEGEDLANMGSWERDLRSENLLWSDKMFELFGRDKGLPLILSEVDSQLVPEDLQKIMEITGELFKHPNVPYYHTYRIKTPNGIVKTLEGRVKSITDSDGTVIKMSGFVRDVTHEKERDRILMEVLKTSLDGVVACEKIVDSNDKIIDFKYLLINEKGCELIGRTEQEVVGNNLLTLFPNLVGQGIFEKYVRVAETGITEVTEAYYPFDGCDQWFKILISPITNGIVITFSDITKDVEEKGLILEIQDLAKIGRFEWNIALDKVDWSDITHEIFEIRRGQIKLNFDSYLHFVHLEDYSKITSLISEAIKGGNIVPFENRIFTYTGQLKYLKGRIKPMLDHDGNVYKLIGYVQDVTELESAKEDLKTTNENLENIIESRTKELTVKHEQLKRVNEDLDNFIYTASHDLKSPVSNIEGLVNHLSELTGNNEELLAITEMMQFSIERFKKTLLDITEVAKVSDIDSSYCETISIPALIDEIKTDIKSTIEQNQAIIIPYLKQEFVSFSRKNLRSIFFNIISNSIKYRSADRSPEIIIQSIEEDNYIKITFQDNGIGFKKANLTKAFKLFKRFNTHVEGSGVGLYIVKRIMEQAGGKIELDSTEGMGTTITLYIPFLQ